MKKLILYIIYFTYVLSVPTDSYCNDLTQTYYSKTPVNDLEALFKHASSTGDQALINTVVNTILNDEDSDANLLNALSKYSEKGKIDFALHNAIAKKDVLSSIILAHHSKDVNSYRGQEKGPNFGSVRDTKTPIEISLESDVTELIPYLLMRKANPSRMRAHEFIYSGEEDVSYYNNILGSKPTMHPGGNGVKPYYDFNKCKRTLISDAIILKRLDVIKMLHKFTDLNKTYFHVAGIDYTPLQLSLALKHDDIALFLLNNGAVIQ